MKKLVQRGYDRANAVIAERSAALIQIAEALLEREVLDGAEVRLLIEGHALPPLPVVAKPPKDKDSDTQHPR